MSSEIVDIYNKPIFLTPNRLIKATLIFLALQIECIVRIKITNTFPDSILPERKNRYNFFSARP